MTRFRVLFASILSLSVAATAWAMDGRVVDKRSGAAVAGAEVIIVGLTGSTKTDADGRFTWKPDPRPPFTILVILPDGRVSKPVRVDKLEAVGVLTVPVEAAVSEEVVVAGVAPSIEAAPGSAMTLISSREVALRAPANLMQAIENVPGVSQVSEGQAAVPAVRGLARGRTLVLIDGSRVSSERRAGPSAGFLDPSVVEGVDVARGPGSVAYGSDAIGGVISVRTRRPGHTGTTFDASATVGAGVPDRRAEFSFTRGFGTGGLLLSGHVRDVDDYRGPDEDVLNSGYADRGLLIRLDKSAHGGLWSFSWQGDFGRDIERPRNNSNVIRFYSPHENSHRFNASFERAKWRGLDLMKVSGFIGLTDQRTDQDRFATATRARDITRSDITARDFQFRVSADKLFGDTKFEMGLDVNGRAALEAHDILVQYDLGGDVASETDNLSIDSARRTNTGVFAQIQAPVGASITASGGIRADYVSNVNEGGFFGDRSVSHGAAAGFVALTAGPYANTTLTAQVARGFRDPTLSDRFYRGPTGRGFITGNPDLEPESSLQLDLGVRYASGRLRLAGYYYHYRITDLVERYQTETDFFFFRNRGRARIHGAEFEAQSTLGGGFTLEATVQRGRGRALDDDEALDDISTDSAAMTLRKAFAARFMAFVRVAAYADDDRPGPSEIAAPGYTSLDVGANWDAHRRLEIRGAVRNVLNETYYASPDPRFVLAPGVNGFVTVRVRF